MRTIGELKAIRSREFAAKDRGNQSLMRLPLPLLVLNAIVVVVCALGLYRVSIRGTVDAELHSTGQQIVVASAREGSPLRTGDHILAADSVVVGNDLELEHLLDGYVEGDKVKLRVERDGREMDLTVRLVPFYNIFFVITIAAVGTIFLILGLMVLVRRRNDKAALVFHLAMNCVAIMIMATAGSHNVPPYGIGWGVAIVYTTAYTFLPFLFFHFTLLFPNEKWTSRKRVMAFLYGVATILSLWLATTFILGIVSPSRAFWVSLLIRAFVLCQWLFIVGSVVSLGSLVQTYLSTQDQVERIRLRWLLAGASVAPLAFILLWLLPDLIWKKSILEQEAIILLSSLTPIAFAIGIVRHRLLDIDLILSRSTAYAMVIGLLAAVYVGGVALAGVFVHDTAGSNYPALVGAALIAILFAPARARIQRWVDRRFFRVRYDFREAQRNLIESIRDAIDVESIGRLIVDGLDALLAPERIAFVAIEGTETPVVIARGIDIDELEKVEEELPSDQDDSIPWVDPFRVEPGLEVRSSFGDLLRMHGLALAQRTRSSGQEAVSLLVVGQKKSNTRLTSEDRDLINAVMTQASLAIDRIMLQKRLLLEQARAGQLRELSEMKSLFVRNVSHEMKTPLTSIRMFAELLQEGVDPEKAKEYGLFIEGESRRLSRSITNILDYARVEKGIKEYTLRTADLDDLVDEAIRVVAYQLRAGGFQLKRTRVETPKTIEADTDALLDAVVNLISNAMKYSGSSRDIEVETATDGESHRVVITDHGIGIDPDEVASIFEPFYRSSIHRTTRVAGTGLGLALVRHTMEAHGGEVLLTSRPGGGSSFTLRFPSIQKTSA